LFKRIHRKRNGPSANSMNGLKPTAVPWEMYVYCKRYAIMKLGVSAACTHILTHIN